MKDISLKKYIQFLSGVALLAILIFILSTVCSAQDNVLAVDDQYRISMIEAVVAKWEGIDATTSSARWQKAIRSWLEFLNTEQLESALAAATYDELVVIINQPDNQLASTGTVGQPLATGGKLYYSLDPCRIVDTRIASGIFSGPVDSGTVISFNARDSSVDQTDFFAIQGGNSGSCGVPVNAEAVVANITSTQQSGKGNLKAYPWGINIPHASLINFSAGINIANATILPLCTTSCSYDFSVSASWASTHVVVDVMGYFAD